MAATERTPKKPTKAARSPDVVVKVDAKLKKAYDTLVAEIQKASLTEMQDFDRRWEAAGAIINHDPPLYVVGGHRNANEFFRAVMKEEPRSASRYVRVARFASPRDEERYGVAKLDAALGFIEAKLGKPLEHPPLPVALDRLHIPVDAGETATKSLEDASVSEIAAATGKLTSASRKKPKTAARTAVEKSLARVTSLKAVRVSERSGMLSFDGVPLAALDGFARALLNAKLP